MATLLVIPRRPGLTPARRYPPRLPQYQLNRGFPERLQYFTAGSVALCYWAGGIWERGRKLAEMVPGLFKGWVGDDCQHRSLVALRAGTFHGVPHRAQCLASIDGLHDHVPNNSRDNHSQDEPNLKVGHVIHPTAGG